MRPIDRREAPREYKKYQDAASDLVERIGEFCSYCEMPLSNAPEVEHILPQKHHPELKTDWNNFLLACKSCNTNKSSVNFALEDICLPYRDNTFLAFTYYEGGILAVNPLLNKKKRQIATATMELVKLDRYPGLKEPTAKDKRYLKRSNAWNKAVETKNRLEQNPSQELEDTVVDLMCETGFWSVWMTVFEDDAHMRQRFIDAIQGTHKDSFDANTRPLPRGKI